MTTDGEQEELSKLLQSFWMEQGHPEARRRAQNELCQRLKPVLARRALLAVNHNEELAKVALQEAWLKIFRSAKSYDPSKSKVQTWAKMITSQCAKDQLRDFYKDLPPDVVGTDMDGEACPYGTPDTALEARQFGQAVADCIAALPGGGTGPNYRLAMELVLDDEVSRVEMVDILAAHQPGGQGLNLEQVQVWIRRARAKVKACLQGKQLWQQKGGNHE